MPRALILDPHRRSMVSSMPITTGPVGSRLSKDMKQQSPRQATRIPARLVEHFVITAEARFIPEPHHAQRLRHRAFAGSQHRACYQNENMVPYRCRKAWPEHRKPNAQDPRS